MNESVDIAVVILTLNESVHLPRALDHIKGFAREIFVIDSFSTDNTAELAKVGGAQVILHPFQSHAQQFQWALENAPITAQWVMKLDADEVVEPDLADEIRKRLPNLPEHVTGINLNRKTIFRGKFIRHGGRYPLTLLRIWRRGKARVEDRWMDEHIYLTEGSAVGFKGGFADHNLNDLTFFTAKHNVYASREALQVLSRRLYLLDSQRSLVAGVTSQQAKVKRILKESVYDRVPFEISSVLYFLYRYILRLGFLDGRDGLTYHVLQAFWYRFLVGSKLRELEEAVRMAKSKDEWLSIIERLSHQHLN
ncbi:glycosyltransferase family 2 protein [Occallatibacter savannae]|uniref:glycosyltransferase family 2 protein n=1 Tax=Occallatibacter savannae TaxID=1002691 RepID=UPI000D69A5D3|nr:glycosyltransferase family 2 protein [Occallatibacter savannae]